MNCVIFFTGSHQWVNELWFLTVHCQQLGRLRNRSKEWFLLICTTQRRDTMTSVSASHIILLLLWQTQWHTHCLHKKRYTWLSGLHIVSVKQNSSPAHRWTASGLVCSPLTPGFHNFWSHVAFCYKNYSVWYALQVTPNGLAVPSMGAVPIKGVLTQPLNHSKDILCLAHWKIDKVQNCFGWSAFYPSPTWHNWMHNIYVNDLYLLGTFNWQVKNVAWSVATAMRKRYRWARYRDRNQIGFMPLYVKCHRHSQRDAMLNMFNVNS